MDILALRTEPWMRRDTNVQEQIAPPPIRTSGTLASQSDALAIGHALRNANFERACAAALMRPSLANPQLPLGTRVHLFEANLNRLGRRARRFGLSWATARARAAGARPVAEQFPKEIAKRIAASASRRHPLQQRS